MIKRWASIVTGLRVAKEPPVSNIGSNEIAASPVEIAYRVEFSSGAVNSPCSSVILVSLFTCTGAPAIGVLNIVSLKVTSVTGGVAVAVGVTVGVSVTVGVGVTVGVAVAVNVGVAVKVGVTVGVQVGVGV